MQRVPGRLICCALLLALTALSACSRKQTLEPPSVALGSIDPFLRQVISNSREAVLSAIAVCSRTVVTLRPIWGGPAMATRPSAARSVQVGPRVDGDVEASVPANCHD